MEDDDDVLAFGYFDTSAVDVLGAVGFPAAFSAAAFSRIFEK